MPAADDADMRWHVMGARPQNPDDQAIYALLLSMYESYGQAPSGMDRRAASGTWLSLPLRVGICAAALAVTMLSNARPPAIAERRSAVSIKAAPAIMPEARGVPMEPAIVVPAWQRAHPAKDRIHPPNRPRPAGRASAPARTAPPAIGIERRTITMSAASVEPIESGGVRERETGEGNSHVSDSRGIERDAQARRALDAIRTLRLH